MARVSFSAFLAGIGLLGAACAGGPGRTASQAFVQDWQDDGGKSIAAVQTRLAGARLPAAASVAVGVTPAGLVGMGLDGSGKWSHPAKLDARPQLAGAVVVASGAGSVFALDALTGKKLWSVPTDGRRLRGAGDDGKTTVVSLGGAGGGRSLILAVGRSGTIAQRIEAEPEVGQPAVVGDTIFVPWGNQYVSAIDLGSGKEVGRLLLREQVSRAAEIGGQVWFGELALLRFDEKIAQASAGRGSRVSLPARELPGNPAWFTHGAAVTPATSSARDRIRLYARPAEQEIGIDAERYAATYFRIAMGLATTDSSLRWVRTFNSDVIAGAAAKSGFVFCDTQGNLRMLASSNGGDAGQISLGTPLRACVVQAGAFSIGAGKDAGALPRQIGQALELNQHDMAVAQRFLLRELGRLPDSEVTKTLIDIASSTRTSPMLLEDARKLLAARRSGEKHMLEALARKYDFLSDVLRPPPVGPLADALSAMKEGRAAPLLAQHLNDPANSPDDVERAARALVKLATPAELEELKTFFALYRATADQEELVRAVLYTAETLLRIGGNEARALIERAAHDPLTHPDVKRGLTSLAPSQEPQPNPAAG